MYSCLELCLINMCIDLGCGNACVAENLLQGADIDMPIFVHKGRDSVFIL